MGRDQRMVAICREYAQLGLNDSGKLFYHGAVVATGSTILGGGYNHNLRQRILGRILPSLHAEINALLSSNLRQCELHRLSSKVA